MKVQKALLTKLLVKLGVDTADGWSTAQLAAKVNQTPGGITRFREDGQVIEDAELSALYDSIAADQAAGNLTEIEESTGEAAVEAAPTATPFSAPEPVENGTPEPKKRNKGKRTSKAKTNKAPKAKKSKAGSEDGSNWNRFGTWEKRKEYYKKHPLEISDRAVVLKAVVKELEHAGKRNKPVTKKALLDILTEKFKDRDSLKMKTTLDNTVPGRLTWKYGLNVKKQKLDSGEFGYFIPVKATAAAK